MSEQRNLICHIYPRKCGKWRRTVDHLLAHWSQFDGRKIITVATDDCCDSAETVMASFLDWTGRGPAHEIDWIVEQNVPGLQEVASFLPMLERLKGEPGITLYCHAKGSTHCDDKAASHLWCDGMAAACLDYPELVDCMLTDKNICGAFRSHGLWSFPGYHNWHFAGTWFWFKNSRTFELDWRNVHPNFMGVEAWPGIFPVDDSGCLFFDNANTAHLYDREFWRHNITPSLEWWHKSLGKCGLRVASQEILASREPATVS